MIFIAFMALVFHVNYNEKTIAFGPTILTTLGMFATFIGIALGLSKFQTTNIQASVPELLSGLKTAFWGSVFGVGFALTLKLRHYILGVRLDPHFSDFDSPNARKLAPVTSTIGKLLKGLVGVRGFEPPTPSSRTRCATRLRYTPTSPRRG